MATDITITIVQDTNVAEGCIMEHRRIAYNGCCTIKYFQYSDDISPSPMRTHEVLAASLS